MGFHDAGNHCVMDGQLHCLQRSVIANNAWTYSFMPTWSCQWMWRWRWFTCFEFWYLLPHQFIFPLTVRETSSILAEPGCLHLFILPIYQRTSLCSTDSPILEVDQVGHNFTSWGWGGGASSPVGRLDGMVCSSLDSVLIHQTRETCVGGSAEFSEPRGNLVLLVLPEGLEGEPWGLQDLRVVNQPFTFTNNRFHFWGLSGVILLSL